MLEDDRLVYRYEVIRGQLQEELDFINALPFHVFEWLYNVIGDPDPSDTPMAIMSDCKRSAHIAASFIHDRFLRLPLQLPFKLGIGDPVLNIQELRKAEEVCDSEVGWKIQRLARKGYAMPKLATAVKMIARLNWTMAGGEQLFGLLKKCQVSHRRFGSSMMRARVICSACRVLFEQSKGSNYENKLKQELKRLAKRQPEKISGKGEFLREAFRTAQESKGGPLSQAERRQIVAHHGKHWNQAKHDKYFKDKARQAQFAAVEEILQKKEMLQEQLDLHLRRQDEEKKQNGLLHHLSDCKLTQKEKKSADVQWETWTATQAEVDKMRQEVQQFQVLSIEYKMRLENVPLR